MRFYHKMKRTSHCFLILYTLIIFLHISHTTFLRYVYMNIFIEQGQTPKPTNEITPVVESTTERYQRVYGTLLQDVFTSHQALYATHLPSREELEEWSGDAHAVVEYYGDIAHSMGIRTVDVTIQPDAPGEQLYRLLLTRALQPRPLREGLNASLSIDPTGATWMRQRNVEEQTRHPSPTTSLSGVDRAIIRATELF